MDIREGCDKGYSIPVEDFLKDVPEGTVILAGDPIHDKSVEDVRHLSEKISDTSKLVELYASVNNKWGIIEDTVYDYEEGTEEYKKACEEVDAWESLMDELEEKVTEAAKKENLFNDACGCSLFEKLGPFMNKYGYRDGNGWWV